MGIQKKRPREPGEAERLEFISSSQSIFLSPTVRSSPSRIAQAFLSNDIDLFVPDAGAGHRPRLEHTVDLSLSPWPLIRCHWYDCWITRLCDLYGPVQQPKAQRPTVLKDSHCCRFSRHWLARSSWLDEEEA